MERRRSPRRVVDYPVWLALGPAPRDCILHDVSDGGANLRLPVAEDLPDEFVLLLTRDGSRNRRCRIVWRNAQQVGVRFVAAGVPVTVDPDAVALEC